LTRNPHLSATRYVAWYATLSSTEYVAWYATLSSTERELGTLGNGFVASVPAAGVAAFEAWRNADPTYSASSGAG
jgi:hypothetical protein